MVENNSGSTRKLVEVYIDTDSESYTSSEGAAVSDELGTEATLTAEDMDVEEEEEEEEGENEGIEEDRKEYENKNETGLGPAQKTQVAIDPSDSPFPEISTDFDDNGGFDLYDRDEDVFHTAEGSSQITDHTTTTITPATSSEILAQIPPSSETHFAVNSDEGSVPPSSPAPQSDSHTSVKVGTNKEGFQYSPQSPEAGTKDDAHLTTDTPTTYCLCKDSLWDALMIRCHGCHGYFHGDCVGMSRQKTVLLKCFYCPLCTNRDPSLVIEFETRSSETKKEGKEVGGSSGGLKEVGRGSGGHKEVGGGSGAKKKVRSGKHSRRCGECIACLNMVDCKRCRFCRDLPKYGGQGRMRQKCIKRQCLLLSKILYVQDPLQSNYAPVIQKEMAEELIAAGGEVPVAIFGGNRSATVTIRDGRDTEAALARAVKPSSSDTAPKKKPVGKRGKPGGGGKGGGVKKIKVSTKNGAAKKGRPDVDEIIQNGSIHRSRRTFANSSSALYSREDFYTPTHCLGPDCINEARPHSKYCSEECGIQLALRRIRTYLPDKKKLVGPEEPIATIRNREKLCELEEEQTAIKNRLDQLDKQVTAINNHMNKLARCTPAKEEESFEAESDDLTIHCATCSQPITLKKAMVHLERCFSKLEGMVSFGSIVKNEGTNIFCDKYDSSQKTYCKRLKVLCPEHTKEPKIGPKEPCGCPLDSLFPSVNKDCPKFCDQPRKSCIKHYCWEKIRRAEIDQERLNLYLKLEEVGEQTRLNQWQIKHRSSLLAIMLHHTIDHSKKHSGCNGEVQEVEMVASESLEETTR